MRYFLYGPGGVKAEETLILSIQPPVKPQALINQKDPAVPKVVPAPELSYGRAEFSKGTRLVDLNVTPGTSHLHSSWLQLFFAGGSVSPLLS